ncbi:N-lysine methyltransferase SMYD2-like, partial [Argonauta hians]
SLFFLSLSLLSLSLSICYLYSISLSIYLSSLLNLSPSLLSLSRPVHLERCSQCLLVYYCDSSCKEEDCALHYLECVCYQNQDNPTLPPTQIRILLRLIRRWQLQDHCKEFDDGALWKRQFIDLMSHYKDLKRDGTTLDVTKLHQVAGQSFELPSDETLFEMYGKMLINCFAIPDEDYTFTIGTGLYLASSKMDHSCSPNVLITYNGTEQSVRALRYIEDPVADKMFITYVDNDRPSWIRKDYLQKNYFFDCSCELCEDQETLDGRLTSVQCPESQCVGYIGMSVNTENAFYMLPCCVCGVTQTSATILEETKSLWNYGTKKIEELRSLDKLKDHEKQLQLAEEILAVLSRSRLYEANLIYVEVMEMAKEASIELRLWSKAADYASRVWPQKQHYFVDPDNRLGFLLYELGKLYVNANRLEEARVTFKKSGTIIRKFHSSADDIYKQQEILEQYCEAFASVVAMPTASSDKLLQPDLASSLSFLDISRITPQDSCTEDREIRHSDDDDDDGS